MICTMLDVHAVRARFPALSNSSAAFLDGPAGSQVPQAVADAMRDQMLAGTANDGGAFSTSVAANALIARARSAAAALTASSPAEIVLGPNMTTLNFALAHAVARTLQPGDEIVVTDLDHDANVAPWLRVAEDHGLVVKTAPVDPSDVTLDVDALEALLGPRTKIVAFTLASNAVGSIPDAQRIADAAHHAGALAWADGVHLAPHRRPDRAAIGADVLLCSPYKFFGPHAGIASIRRDLAESLPADRVRPAAQDPPGHRFETGTPSFEALAGLVAAIDYLHGLGAGDLDQGYAAIREREDALCIRALEGFARLEHVTLHGIADPARVAERTPTFSVTVDGRTPREVAETLARDGIHVWDGDFYAYALIRALGLAEHGGAVRAGLLHYTTDDEVDRLLEALAALR
jgi:cysteine desulfurase family protein (TIGR01976 family)